MEYLVAAQFIHAGMLREGLETIEDVRWRFDGERRNPWDEPECGHHYARAMSAWSSVVAWSGFHYHAADRALTLSPKTNTPAFTSFWSTGAGWGLFSVAPENGRSRTKITVIEGSLPLRTIRCGKPTANPPTIAIGGRALANQAKRQSNATTVILDDDLIVQRASEFVILI
jgi:hypothetical protein